MSIFDRIREYLRRHNDLSAGRDPVWDDAPTATMALPVEGEMTITYEPHGIDTPEKLAEIKARAEADALAAQASAQTEQWGTWDEPGTPLAPPAFTPPPPSPYSSDMSRAMVHQIAYPDPLDLSPDRDRKYRDMLRRVGVATGTHTSLEDTGVWALPALPPGDGSGVRL